MLVAGYAVKAVPVESPLLPELIHEAELYTKLVRLQNVGILPRVKSTGYLLAGTHFGFAMELLGSNLAALTPQQRRSFKERAMTSLAALHDAGFLHGDVRLENFVTAPGGRVVLIDLGFARPATAAEDMNTELEQLTALFQE